MRRRSLGNISIRAGTARLRGLSRPGLDLDTVGETLPGTQHILLANLSRQRLQLALTGVVGKGKDMAVLLVAARIRTLVDGLLQHTGIPCLDEIPVISVS